MSETFGTWRNDVWRVAPAVRLLKCWLLLLAVHIWTVWYLVGRRNCVLERKNSRYCSLLVFLFYDLPFTVYCRRSQRLRPRTNATSTRWPPGWHPLARNTEQYVWFMRALDLLTGCRWLLSVNASLRGAQECQIISSCQHFFVLNSCGFAHSCAITSSESHLLCVNKTKFYGAIVVHSLLFWTIERIQKVLLLLLLLSFVL